MSFVYALTQQISLTPTISRLFFKAARDFFPYEAGQYLEVVQPDGIRTPLSIANAPLDCAQLEIHLAHPPDNLSAQRILQILARDAVLNLGGPFGVCTKSELDATRPIIFIARDTGFAPIKAIIESFQTEKNYPAMHLYWRGENYLADLAEDFVSSLKNFSYTKIADQSVVDVVSADYSSLAGYQIYMVDTKSAVQKAFQAFLKMHLRHEDFYSDNM